MTFVYYNSKVYENDDPWGIDVFLTTKGRYAVIAMLDLASNPGQDSVKKVSEIAERHDIALNYLEQLFFRLKKANLISAVRGPSGGYRLNRSISEINVLDIVHAVGEKTKFTRCSGQLNCSKEGKKCKTHDLWEGIESLIYNQLHSITLEKILHNNLLAVVNSNGLTS